MPGDYTRLTFDPLKDRAMVLEQQGRVHLDADFNELAAIIERRIRVETRDIVGPAVYPAVEPTSFQVTGSSATGYGIGWGRMYVDGLLAENHGVGDPVDYEPVWDEPRGETLSTPFDDQPYAGTQPTAAPALPALFYLDVWQRELTCVEDPSVLEPALGVDTTTRVQTAWRVGTLGLDSGAPACDGDWSAYQPWLDLIRPSAGRLSSAAVGPVVPTDPCAVAPIGGYRGLDNRLYRVEIHDGGGVGEATVKWSRDNGAVASRITALTGGATQSIVTVDRLGRDDVLRFHKGEWVELLDDVLELDRQPGKIVQVVDVDPTQRTVTVDGVVAGLIDQTRNPRLRRWDQGKPTGGVSTTPDAATGTIAVSALPMTIDLEDGVQITLDLATPPSGQTTGTFHVGDWWVFAARPGVATVETLDRVPPRGVRHHFARLAIDSGTGSIIDCRVPWPGDCECDGGDCSCDACVTVASHAGGDGPLTLQAAIDLVGSKGGRICVAPGVYTIAEPLKIAGVVGLTIVGAGSRTIIAAEGEVGIVVQDSAEVSLERFTLLGGSLAGLASSLEDLGDPNAAPIDLAAILASLTGGTGLDVGVALLNTIDCRVDRCFIAVATRNGVRATVGIGAAGPAVRTRMVDNVVVADVAVGSLIAGRTAGAVDGPTDGDVVPTVPAIYDVAGDRKSLLTVDLSIIDNVLLGNRFGVDLGGVVLVDEHVFTGLTINTAGTRVERNLVLGAAEAGISVLGIALPTSTQPVGGPGVAATSASSLFRTSGTVGIRDNVVAGKGFGIKATGEAAQIVENWVYGPLASAVDPDEQHEVDGIAITPWAGSAAASRLGPGDASIAGNTVVGAGRYGIAVLPLKGSAAVTGNRVELSGVGGIVFTSIDPKLVATDVAVTDNVVVTSGIEQAPALGVLAGITVTLAEIARVSGNVVRGVAELVDGSVVRYGIRVSNCDAVRVDDNQLADLGPDEAFGGSLAGISASRIGVLHVRGNTVRLGAGGEGTPGIALDIDDARIHKSRFKAAPAQVIDHLIAADGPFLEGAPGLLPEAAVDGNTLQAPGAGKQPVARILGSHTVTFNANQCRATTALVAPLLLVETTGAAIISSNHVESPLGHGVPSIDLTTGLGSGAQPLPRCTVVGNITAGPIRLNGAALAAPWAPLNITH